MRQLARNLLEKTNPGSFATGLLPILRNTRRNFQGVDSAIIDSYFAKSGMKKLHLGCGSNLLQDWLNSDYCPQSDAVLRLDATKTFPFADASMDYILSEHMIEHLTHSDGTIMLAQCHRILRRNGKIRVSTPDLSFLVGLYSKDKSDLQKDYIKWSSENFIKDAPCIDDTFVINNFVRDWGHLFIYDEKTLRASLEHAGFNDIKRVELNQSEDEALRDLENEERLPKGFLRLESQTLEATKTI